MRNKALKNVALYGVGGVGENIAYNLFYMCFIFFLTSVAGIKPAAAGTISLIAVMWDAISDPIVGYLSDRYKGFKDFGKRGSFILFGAIPLGISVFLLYNDMLFTGGAKVAYFIVINGLFWTFFTMVDIPYVSMATEITEDYDVKTKMRTSVMIFSNIGQLILSFGILQFADYMAGIGYEDAFTWRIIGAAMGFLSTISFMIVAVSMRGKEVKNLETVAAEGEKLPASQNKMEVYKDLILLLKMHDYRVLIAIGFFYNIFLGVVSAALLYYALFSCGLTMAQSSIVQTIALFVSLALIVPAGESVVKFGKKPVLVWSFALMFICSLLCGIMKPGMVIFTIMNVILNVTAAVFWIDIYAMNFDVSEIFEFKHGFNREGLMISVCSFMTKVGVAIGMWLVGVLMEVFAVDPEAEVVTDTMVRGMQYIYGIVPAIVSAILLICALLYRVKKEHIMALQEAKELKAEGKEYSTAGFDKVL